MPLQEHKSQERSSHMLGRVWRISMHSPGGFNCFRRVSSLRLHPSFIPLSPISHHCVLPIYFPFLFSRSCFASLSFLCLDIHATSREANGALVAAQKLTEIAKPITTVGGARFLWGRGGRPHGNAAITTRKKRKRWRT